MATPIMMPTTTDRPSTVEYKALAWVLGVLLGLALGLLGWLGNRAFDQLDSLTSRVSSLEAARAVSTQYEYQSERRADRMERKLDEIQELLRRSRR